MRILIRTTLLASMLALMAGAALATDDEKKVDLKVGDTAPAFQSTDDQGLTWKSSDHLGKKYIVVCFYPGDFTPGCTAQAKKFQENMNKLYDQGAEVVVWPAWILAFLRGMEHQTELSFHKSFHKHSPLN